MPWCPIITLDAPLEYRSLVFYSFPRSWSLSDSVTADGSSTATFSSRKAEKSWLMTSSHSRRGSLGQSSKMLLPRFFLGDSFFLSLDDSFESPLPAPFAFWHLAYEKIKVIRDRVPSIVIRTGPVIEPFACSVQWFNWLNHRFETVYTGSLAQVVFYMDRTGVGFDSGFSNPPVRSGPNN